MNPHVIDYVNQTLLDEVINHNQFTTVFQNYQQSTNGKFSLPLGPDHFIRLLIKGNTNSKYRYKIQIIPISINYERVLDNQMKTDYTNIFNTMRSIYTLRKG